MSEESTGAAPELLGKEDLGDAAFSGPALFITRSLVTMGTPGFVRLAFVEQEKPGKPIHFRAAVSMSLQQAIALKDLMTRQLAPLESQINEMIAEAEAEAAAGAAGGPDVEP